MATFDDAIRVTATGVTQATSGTAARFAVPVTSAGTAPRYVRLAAINESYAKAGDSTVTATTNDVLVQPSDCVILNVQNCTHISVVQGTTAGRVNAVPLEDQ